jgi:tripeptidyl-peptidase-1
MVDMAEQFANIAYYWPVATAQRVDISCNLMIKPQCLLELYNVHYKADSKNGNTVVYAFFVEEYAKHEDLSEFETIYDPCAAGER